MKKNKNPKTEKILLSKISRQRVTQFWLFIIQLPPAPSLTKLQMPASARAMSPELPAVHYSKNRTPPVARMSTSDSRGTIILTQANLTGKCC